jgi:hypothetical protein
VGWVNVTGSLIADVTSFQVVTARTATSGPVATKVQPWGPRAACELGQGTCSPPTDELFVEFPFRSGGHRMA